MKIYINASVTKTSLIALTSLYVTGTALGAFPNPPDALYKELTAKHLTIKPVEGGAGGDQLYHPYLASGEHVRRITVHWYDCIDGITLETTSGQKMLSGNDKGSGDHPEQTHQDSFPVSSDQYITAIVIKVAGWEPHDRNYTVVRGITFVIQNKDGTQTSKTFGQTPTATLAADPGQEICGFWGWHGTVLDSIGIITRPH